MRVNPLAAALGFVLIELDLDASLERLDAMTDARGSIVQPDGTVGGIDRASSPYWKNKQAPGPGATNTAPAAQPSGNGAHSMTGLPRGGCNVSPRASGEGFGDG